MYLKKSTQTAVIERIQLEQGTKNPLGEIKQKEMGRDILDHIFFGLLNHKVSNSEFVLQSL